LLAHLLTGARLALVGPFFWWMAQPDPRSAALAGGCLGLAIGSDLLDGPAARWQSSASPFGRLFDHATDCAFVVAGLCAVALRHALPWLLPVLVAAAFAQYVFDSLWLARARELRMSSLGRWNGILYFFPLGGDVLARLGVPGLGQAVTALAWLLVASTLLSMADRARAPLRSS
jgi:phosphatidylglycerophosphate synthase